MSKVCVYVLMFTTFQAIEFSFILKLNKSSYQKHIRELRRLFLVFNIMLVFSCVIPKYGMGTGCHFTAVSLLDVCVW